MIITCPSCNRRFDLQRRPPKQFRCPKCGFTTAFSEVLNNGGNNKEQNITLNEEAAAAMGIGAGPVPNTSDIAPATPGTLGASTTLAQPTGGNASLPTGNSNKTKCNGNNIILVEKSGKVYGSNALFHAIQASDGGVFSITGTSDLPTTITTSENADQSCSSE